MPSTKSMKAINVFILATCLWIVSSCSEPPLPAEQQILNNLKLAKSSVEQLNPKELREILAPEFEITGVSKHYDYELIKKTMTLYGFRKQRINIILSATTVNLDKYNSQLASLESTALITGSRGLFPDDGQIYKIKSQWRLYDDEWKITQLSWD